MKFWLIAPHTAQEKNEFENAWNYDLEHNTIAISWFEIGDPSGYQNITELKEKLDEQYKEKDNSIAAKEIWDFYHNIQPGDRLIARKGRSQIIGIGLVLPNSNVYYNKEKGISRTGNDKRYSANFRNVIWREINIEYNGTLSRNTLVEKDKIFYDSIITDLFSYDDKKTRTDEIIEALENMGGVAHYKEIAEYIKSNTKKGVPLTLEDNIRSELERKSSDSTAFQGKTDLFYSHDGLGNGIWGLRDYDKKLEDKSIEELRNIAYLASRDSVVASKSYSNYRKRSSEVKAYILARAKGFCEGCNEKAPFMNKEGNPYLETHHVSKLADGGPDDPRFVIALCPNCHRKAHHSNIHEKYNQELIKILLNKEEIII